MKSLIIVVLTIVFCGIAYAATGGEVAFYSFGDRVQRFENAEAVCYVHSEGGIACKFK